MDLVHDAGFSNTALTLGGVAFLVGLVYGLAKLWDIIEARVRGMIKPLDDKATVLSLEVAGAKAAIEIERGARQDFEKEAYKAFVTQDALTDLKSMINQRFDDLKHDVREIRQSQERTE